MDYNIEQLKRDNSSVMPITVSSAVFNDDGSSVAASLDTLNENLTNKVNSLSGYQPITVVNNTNLPGFYFYIIPGNVSRQINLPDATFIVLHIGIDGWIHQVFYQLGAAQIYHRISVSGTWQDILKIC